MRGSSLRKAFIGAGLLLSLVPFLGFAAQQFPKPVGYVNDFAGVMKENERSALETKLENYNASSGNEVVVVTLQSLNGDVIENVASTMFKEWGIGKKGSDNGVLLIAAIDEHRLRIEVGYGLEGVLTDAASNNINASVIVPEFKNGNYYSGLDKGTDAIIGVLGGMGTVPETAPSNSQTKFDWFWLIFAVPVWLASILGRSRSWWAGGVLGGIGGVIVAIIYGFMIRGLVAIIVLIPFGLLFDFLVSRAYERGKTTGHFPWWIGGGRGGWGGGGGGGFGGFGGGSSGGGGSSSRW